MNYYNENDPFAIEWLRHLIKAGAISDGFVDTRSIVEVKPEDLKDFIQCHFFAGIGVWSYALRCAGWPDDRRVWTGSCPCQPFSGSGKKTGFSDVRHLWPVWFPLIRQCRPPVVLGEQVASKDGLIWIDLVSTDMEGEDYAIGAVDLCAAGAGAPHIRQRLYFVADDNRRRCEVSTTTRRLHDHGPCGDDADRRGEPDGLADVSSDGRREERADSGRLDAGDRAERWTAGSESSGEPGGLGDTGSAGLQERERDGRVQREALGASTREAVECGSDVGGLADAGCERRQQDPGSASRDEAADGRTGRDECESHGDHQSAGHGADGSGMADSEGAGGREHARAIRGETSARLRDEEGQDGRRTVVETGGTRDSSAAHQLADTASERCDGRRTGEASEGSRESERPRDAGGSLADTECAERRPTSDAGADDHADERQGAEDPGRTAQRGGTGELVDTIGEGLEGFTGDGDDGDESGWDGADEERPVAASGADDLLADTECDGRRTDVALGGQEGRTADWRDRARLPGDDGDGGMADTDGGESGDGGVQRGRRYLQQPPDAHPTFWSDCEWIACIDGKSRPIEPGTFPLAHGITNRVGKLRGYGNAICAPLAQAFIESYIEVRLTEEHGTDSSETRREEAGTA